MPLRFKHRREPEPEDPKRSPAEGEALLDRGVLARWYVERRIAEEFERAQRYGRPLTLLEAAPALIPGERPGEAVLAAGIAAGRKIARNTDLLGWGPDATILIIMPETDLRGAEAAASRWQTDLYLRTQSAGGHKWRVRAIDARPHRNLDDLQGALTPGKQKGAAA